MDRVFFQDRDRSPRPDQSGHLPEGIDRIGEAPQALSAPGQIKRSVGDRQTPDIGQDHCRRSVSDRLAGHFQVRLVAIGRHHQARPADAIRQPAGERPVAASQVEHTRTGLDGQGVPISALRSSAKAS